jgi:serine/threonine-protein kinase
MDLRDQLQTSLGNTYAIERELAGGMSRVFVAEDTSLGRRVVVKVLPAELSGTVSVGRFRREIALAAQLQHPHIVPLISAGEVDGLPYYTMPFVEGDSLRARLARGELPIPETISVLRDVARALEYAHARGVTHRDIKPDNVLLAGTSAVITDFGVAKAIVAAGRDGAPGVSAADGTDRSRPMTSIGIALGTPAYMAPEQAAGDPATDHRADIYAFGVMAYEMLAGHVPFAGRSAQAMLAAHAVEAPVPIASLRPGTPPRLAELVMRCVEKRPADRPQSATEILHALEGAATPYTGSTAVGPSAATMAPSPSSRSATMIVAGIVVVGVVAIARA